MDAGGGCAEHDRLLLAELNPNMLGQSTEWTLWTGSNVFGRNRTAV